MSIEEKKQNIVSDFQNLPSWEEKYKKIIQLGKKLPPISEDLLAEKYLVKGCQSQVWLHAKQEENRIYFQGDSDAMIVKGLLAILLEIFSGQDIDEVLTADLSFVNDLGLNVHLSQSRSNGLAAMIKQMKLYAMAFKTMQINKENQ